MYSNTTNKLKRGTQGRIQKMQMKGAEEIAAERNHHPLPTFTYPLQTD